VTARRNRNSLLTVNDVASLLHVHVNTVRQWSNRGILKTYRISSRGDRRFYREDIEDFLVQEEKRLQEETE
jgi:excisionase family DNA binding protein